MLPWFKAPTALVLALRDQRISAHREATTLEALVECQALEASERLAAHSTAGLAASFGWSRGRLNRARSEWVQQGLIAADHATIRTSSGSEQEADITTQSRRAGDMRIKGGVSAGDGQETDSKRTGGEPSRARSLFIEVEGEVDHEAKRDAHPPDGGQAPRPFEAAAQGAPDAPTQDCDPHPRRPEPPAAPGAPATPEVEPASQPDALDLPTLLQHVGPKQLQAVAAALVAHGLDPTVEALVKLTPAQLGQLPGVGSRTVKAVRDALGEHSLALARPLPAPKPEPDPRVRAVTDLWGQVYRETFPGQQPVWSFPRDYQRAVEVADVAQGHGEGRIGWVEALERLRGVFGAYLGHLSAPANWPHEPTLAGFANPVKLAARFTGAAPTNNRADRMRLSTDPLTGQTIWPEYTADDLPY